MKKYITEKEAGYIAYERGIEVLPALGNEVLTVHATATGKDTQVLGQDRKGFYTATLTA